MEWPNKNANDLSRVKKEEKRYTRVRRDTEYISEVRRAVEFS